MKIAVGNDTPGVALAQAVKTHLSELGHTVIDMGFYEIPSKESYLDPARRVSKAVQSGEADRGILICGTGQGMAIAANKFKGVYASCVDTVFAAQRCRMINNANVLTMGGWITGPYLGCAIVDAFLTTEFTENLEARREYLKEVFGILEQHEQEAFK